MSVFPTCVGATVGSYRYGICVLLSVSKIGFWGVIFFSFSLLEVYLAYQGIYIVYEICQVIDVGVFVGYVGGFVKT